MVIGHVTLKRQILTFRMGGTTYAEWFGGGKNSKITFGPHLSTLKRPTKGLKTQTQYLGRLSGTLKAAAFTALYIMQNRTYGSETDQN